MKKIITTTLIACMGICYAPHIFGQDDSTRSKTENNDDDNIPQIIHKKKKSAANLEAPITAGFVGGFNQAYYIIGGNASGSKGGVIVGGVMDIHCVGVLHVEAGLQYIMTGGTNLPMYQTGTDFSVNTIILPVILQFKFGKPGRNHFYIGIGGYAGYNVSGSDANGNKLVIGSTDNADLKAFDIGISSDIGCELKSGLFFRIKGESGLSNLEPSAPTINSRNTSIEVGYLFGKNAQHTTHQHHDPKAWE